jgi:transcriptional regulator with XRE-family HTH domain
LLADDPELQEEYDKLGPRFAAISALITARERCGLTRAALAARMGVAPSAITRLESAAHSPRIDTLAEAAGVMGYDLDVRFKHRKRSK